MRPLFKHRKWQHIFSEQHAMDTIKRKVTEGNHQGADLVSLVTDAFRDYSCDPNLSAYSFIIKNLVGRSLFSQLPPILDHLEKVEKFETSENLVIYLIKSYGRANMLKEAVDIFYRVPNFRCSQSTCSLNSLLYVLCKGKNGLVLAHDVLRRIPQSSMRLDETSFQILVRALCRYGKCHHAIELLSAMPLHECFPDSRMYSLIISSLCKREPSVIIMEFIRNMRKAGFSPSRMDCANIMNVLIKEGRVKDAHDVFIQMISDGIRPDVVTYGILLNGFISYGDFQSGEDLFDEMLLSGPVPDTAIYNSYLKGLCDKGDLDGAHKMIAAMENVGSNADVSTYNILITAYLKAGKMGEAEEVLKKMREKGLDGNWHTYTIKIEGLVFQHEILVASETLEEMLSKGFIPQSSTFERLVFGVCKNDFRSHATKILEDAVG